MRFMKRCWQRRWIRGCVWTLVSLAGIIAFLWAWIDFTGSRQWRKAQARLAREGQPIDLRALAPNPIPEAENFCAIPLLRDLSVVIDDDWDKGEPGKKRARLKAAYRLIFNKKGLVPDLPNAALGQRVDLRQWSTWLRDDGLTEQSGDPSRDMLAVLSKENTWFVELAAGLDRPRAQWTPSWKTHALPRNLVYIRTPHLFSVTELSHNLARRCAAAAYAGDARQAHDAAQILARLSQACQEEPFSEGMLTGAHEAILLANATWDLCDIHSGTAADFERLETALAAMDFRRATCLAFSAAVIEGVNGVRLAEDDPTHYYTSWGLNGPKSHLSPAFRFLPSGIFDANAAVMANTGFDYFIKPLRDRGWKAALSSTHEFMTALIAADPNPWTHPSDVMKRVVFPALDVPFPIYAQTLVNQAIVACALERYRIANGDYPDSLNFVELSEGKHLPVDILTGQPMGYRKTANGKYALWCVSFNEKDHDGTRVLEKERPEHTRFRLKTYAGDWVWNFPEDYRANLMRVGSIPKRSLHLTFGTE
jgi:hypothetical protein